MVRSLIGLSDELERMDIDAYDAELCNMYSLDIRNLSLTTPQVG